MRHLRPAARLVLALTAAAAGTPSAAIAQPSSANATPTSTAQTPLGERQDGEPRGPQAPTVHGRTLDTDGEPVAWVSLQLASVREPERRWTTTSDDRGRFTFSAIPAGRYTLTAFRVGYRTTVLEIEVAERQAVAVEVWMAVEPVGLEGLVAEALRAGARGSIELWSERGALAGPRTVGDLLWESGVGHVTSRGGAGAGQQVHLRGSRPEGVLVLVDGVPANDPITGVADLGLLPAEDLESVRVVPGSGGLLYGPGALGGVLVLRRVSRSDPLRVSAATGAYGFRRLAGSAALRVAGGEVSVGAHRARAENDFPFALRIHPDRPVVRRRNAGVEEFGLRAGWRSVGGRVRASGAWSVADRGVPGPMGTSVFDRARLEVGRWDGSIQVQESGWTVTAHAVGFRQVYRDPANPATNGDWASESAGLTAVRLLSLGAARGTGLLALRRDAAQGTSLLGRPARWAGAAGGAVALPAGVVRLDAGLRADAWTGGPLVWSPELGAVLPAGAAEIRLRLARGVRAPTFADLYFASPLPFVRPPELRPERVVLDAEVGLRVVPAPGVQLDAAAYHRELRDAIVWAPSSFVGWTPRNVDRVRARGFEAEAHLRRGPWTARWRYEWTDPRFRIPGNRARLPYVPGHSLAAALAWDADASARLTVRYVGRRTAGLTGTTRMPPVAVVDVAAAVPVPGTGGRFALAVELLNALDAAYEWIPLYPMPGREWRVAGHWTPFRPKGGPR